MAAAGSGALLSGTLVAATACGSTELCDADCGEAPAICPPPAPLGLEIGDRAEDVELRDCAGQPLALHDLCGERLVLLVTYYGWCASCVDYIELAADLKQTYEPSGLRSLIIIVEDVWEAPATAEYCAAVRDFHGLPEVVAYDAEASSAVFGTTDLAMLLDRNGEIIFKRRGAPLATVRAAVEAELAP